MQDDAQVLLEVTDLRKWFPIQRGVLRRVTGYVRAVDGVDLYIREGESLGLVGESGCGKTTLGRVILRQYPPTTGSVFYRRDGKMVEISKLSKEDLKPFRREMQIIFQDPYSSLNPRMTVMEIVSEPLIVHGVASGEELRHRVRELLELVGLRVQHMNRYPYAFSGGQRQRIGIARALALQPKLIVCDEPVSALDVSIQAQVLNLLNDLQTEFHLTYLFIAHDLSVVENISDRVAVMYLGNIVELGVTRAVYDHPKHPYTEALLSAVPRADPDQVKKRIILPGDVPSPANPPSGCKFHPRCLYALDICAQEEPAWRDVGDEHYVACHRATELSLTGVIRSA